jgi:hypothetical protein
MMNTARRLVAALPILAAPALAYADGETVTENAGTVVVVTPNAPVVVTNGQAQPQAQPPMMTPGMTDPTLPPPAANAAPQNEAWSNVSHINGTVVPVGQRGDYLYQFKKTNISSNPIGWLVGFYGISVSHALTENIALRGDANFMSIDNTSGYEFGVSLPIYFRRTYSGPFIEPGLIVRSTTDNSDCAFASAGTACTADTHTMAGPEMMFGWHWMFDSGLNVAAAFGIARNMSSTQDMNYTSSNIEPAGYFRIGYAF